MFYPIKIFGFGLRFCGPSRGSSQNSVRTQNCLDLFPVLMIDKYSWTLISWWRLYPKLMTFISQLFIILTFYLIFMDFLSSFWISSVSYWSSISSVVIDHVDASQSSWFLTSPVKPTGESSKWQVSVHKLQDRHCVLWQPTPSRILHPLWSPQKFWQFGLKRVLLQFFAHKHV